MSSPWNTNEPEYRIGQARAEAPLVREQIKQVGEGAQLPRSLAEVAADFLDPQEVYRAEYAARDLDESEAGNEIGWNCALHGPFFETRPDEQVPELNYSEECLTQPRLGSWLRAIVRAVPYSYTVRVIPKGREEPYLVQAEIYESELTVTIGEDTYQGYNIYTFTSSGNHLWKESRREEGRWFDNDTGDLNDDQVAAAIEQALRRPQPLRLPPIWVVFTLTTKSNEVFKTANGQREYFSRSNGYRFEQADRELSFWALRGSIFHFPVGWRSRYNWSISGRPGIDLRFETTHVLRFELPHGLESLQNAQAPAASSSVFAPASRENETEPSSKRRKTGGDEARGPRDTSLWY